MDLGELERRLQAHPAFQDLDRWAITDIKSGATSPHTYRFQMGDRDYFVKEVKANEKRILGLLSALDLEIAPSVVYPELLEQDILVARYVRGMPHDSKQLPTTLIRNYARMQNVLNDKRNLTQNDAFYGCTFTDADDGFYRKSITRCIERGYENLVGLRRHRLPIVEAFVEIADHIRTHRESIEDGFSAMPFAWLHHDFREAHIMGDPPKLLDWGSSYGHGPFLFDLAPFLFSDEAGLAVFVADSDICRHAGRKDLERWLYVATCAGFAGFALWRLQEFGYVDGRQDRDACRVLLDYEYPAYEDLLTRTPL